VCGKDELFFEPIRHTAKKDESGGIVVESENNEGRTLAFETVEFDLEDGFYMGFVCSQDCNNTFDCSPTSFTENMVKAVCYATKDDKPKHKF
jgi:hypothetical protein